MKLTTTVSQPIDAARERGVSSMRAPRAAESGGTPRDVVRCGAKGRSKVCQATLLDARLDAIRRAGL